MRCVLIFSDMVKYNKKIKYEKNRNRIATQNAKRLKRKSRSFARSEGSLGQANTTRSQ